MEGQDAECAQQDAFADRLVEGSSVPALSDAPIAEGEFAAKNEPGGGADGAVDAAAGMHSEVDLPACAFGVVWGIGFAAGGSEPGCGMQGVVLGGTEQAGEEFAGGFVLCGDLPLAFPALEQAFDDEGLADAAVAVLDLGVGAGDAVVLSAFGRNRIWGALEAAGASHCPTPSEVPGDAFRPSGGRRMASLGHLSVNPFSWPLTCLR